MSKDKMKRKINEALNMINDNGDNMNNKDMKERIEKLEMKIRGLENDLDELEQQLDDSNKLGKAILEIQDYLTKKSNGYDVDYYPFHNLKK